MNLQENYFWRFNRVSKVLWQLNTYTHAMMIIKWIMDTDGS
jgi:hypothetical protein